jgi:hypothetical protein
MENIYLRADKWRGYGQRTYDEQFRLLISISFYKAWSLMTMPYVSSAYHRPHTQCTKDMVIEVQATWGTSTEGRLFGVRAPSIQSEARKWDVMPITRMDSPMDSML